jgi:hypothetical protein
VASTGSARPDVSSCLARIALATRGRRGEECTDQDDQGEVGVDHVDRAAGQVLRDLRVVGDIVLDGVGEGAIGEAEHQQPGGPAEDRTALQAPSQPER